MVDFEDIGKSREEGWFRANEMEMIKQAKAKREAALQAEKDAAHEEIRKAHWMKCPKCGHDLNEIELFGLKIDKCSSCAGVFFDAGELDELLLKKEDDKKNFFRKLTGLFG